MIIIYWLRAVQIVFGAGNNGRTNHTAGESEATAVELSASEGVRPGVLLSKGYERNFVVT